MFDIPMDLKHLEESIVAYEQEPIVKGKIMFYGHSLFTRWGHPKWGYRRMDEDLRGKDGSLAVVNHGFGTSTCEERLYYYDRMVRPWEPRALVLANFANDGMYGYSPEQSMQATALLLHWARTDFPGIRMYLVEDHPRPKMKYKTTLPDKWNNAMHKRRKYREMLSIYEQTHEDTKVIHLWNRPEFFEEGCVGDRMKIREDIYYTDRGHFNQAGYDILANIVREALDDIL
jgi:lysophospholipase L1-like esterase